MNSQPFGMPGLDRPLFLIGFMGCGKTTAAEGLTRELGVPFWDTDREVARRFGLSVPQIFARHGEASFRAMELEVLEHIVGHYGPCVVACGGGTPTIPGAVALMRSVGWLLYLYLPPEELAGRLQRKRTHRPLIAHLSGRELEEYIRSTLCEREHYYRQAHFVVNACKVSAKGILSLLPTTTSN